MTRPRVARVVQSILSNSYSEETMAKEDVAAGKAKQFKGKVNDVVGALKGDSSQQAKGKVQKAVGKVQEKLGGADKRRANP